MYKLEYNSRLYGIMNNYQQEQNHIRKSPRILQRCVSLRECITSLDFVPDSYRCIFVDKLLVLYYTGADIASK